MYRNIILLEIDYDDYYNRLWDTLFQKNVYIKFKFWVKPCRFVFPFHVNVCFNNWKLIEIDNLLEVPKD